MKFIYFLKNIFSLSNGYQLVWSFLLSKIEESQLVEISIYEVCSKTKLSKKTIYPILNYGFKYFLENDLGVVFYLDRNKIIIKPRIEEELTYLTSPKPLKQHPIPKSFKTSPIKRNRGKLKELNELGWTEEISEVLKYLSEKTGVVFPRDKNTGKIILNRFLEGFSVEQMKFIIDSKTMQWKNTKSERYLRPSTLFSENNIENYLNDKVKLEKPNSITHTQLTHETAETAKSIIDSRYVKKNIDS